MVSEFKINNEEEYALNKLSRDIHDFNIEQGWYDKPREFGTLLMLIVSELAETLEGNRKNLKDSHLPHRSAEEVELADALIRIFDLCGYRGYDIGGALAEKFEYNKHRADHKRENRAAAGGKQY